MHLRRKCILLLSDGTFYNYQLNLSDLLSHLKFLFPYLFFCLNNLSIGAGGVLMSHIITVLLLTSPFMMVTINLICLGASIFIVIFSS